ncbi:hypothetical protein CYJ10_22025 [Cupriavidus pauculus]|uniref:Uncharacterized protein n=2 Tax=Cupriavidus pauculus TaxID=82633 RepID=A0A2N5C8K4_9BURK|nr:hypothetical protein CYJ10_22025 [Cupriavidus pauculus]
MGRLIKGGMYLLSLWLLFVLIFVNKVSVDICLGCPFADRARLLAIAKENYLPIACVAMLLVSAAFYFSFLHLIRGAKDGPYKVLELEDKNAEHLVFLATYVVPLVGFGLESVRQIINLSITLTILGAIYIRTNLFYANPTLSLLGFKIFVVKLERHKREFPQSCVLISREEIDINDSINVLQLDRRIFFAKKAIVIAP